VILDNPPAPVPVPQPTHWLAVAMGAAFAAAIGTKLGEWAIEELRHRFGPTPPSPPPTDTETTP
jgi:hypothetical protein